MATELWFPCDRAIAERFFFSDCSDRRDRMENSLSNVSCSFGDIMILQCTFGCAFKNTLDKPSFHHPLPVVRRHPHLAMLDHHCHSQNPKSVAIISGIC